MLLFFSTLIILQSFVKIINFYSKFIYIYDYLTFEEKQKYFQIKILNKIPKIFINIINKNFSVFLMFFLYSFVHYCNIKENDIENIKIDKYSDELIEEQFQEDVDNNLLLLKKKLCYDKNEQIINENEFIDKTIIENDNNNEETINDFYNKENDEIKSEIINTTRESDEYLLIDNSQLIQDIDILNKDEININEINFGDLIKEKEDQQKNIDNIDNIIVNNEKNIINEKNNDIPNNIENNSENIKVIRIVKKKK